MCRETRLLYSCPLLSSPPPHPTLLAKSSSSLSLSNEYGGCPLLVPPCCLQRAHSLLDCAPRELHQRSDWVSWSCLPSPPRPCQSRSPICMDWQLTSLRRRCISQVLLTHKSNLFLSNAKDTGLPTGCNSENEGKRSRRDRANHALVKARSDCSRTTRK